MKKLLFLLFGLVSLESFTQSFIPNTPTLDLKSYILIEPNTNTVIASFNEDAPIEPASMTKVMSSYVIADQIANDFLGLDDSVLISEKAWRMEGSKMFIEQGKRVSVLDLLKGVIIQSGNDATVALAEYVGGTEDGFVDLMNSYAASMGLSNTLFQNSTGLPDGNHFSSAKDLATMTSLLINNFPETYGLYKEKYYTFNNIRQPNRNRLLWKDNSSDGVKTGHTESAGYCLISSAKRNDMRLIAVVSGAKADKERCNDTQRLLEYGFSLQPKSMYVLHSQQASHLKGIAKAHGYDWEIVFESNFRLPPKYSHQSRKMGETQVKCWRFHLSGDAKILDEDE